MLSQQITYIKGVFWLLLFNVSVKSSISDLQEFFLRAQYHSSSQSIWVNTRFRTHTKNFLFYTNLVLHHCCCSGRLGGPKSIIVYCSLLQATGPKISPFLKKKRIKKCRWEKINALSVKLDNIEINRKGKASLDFDPLFASGAFSSSIIIGQMCLFLGHHPKKDNAVKEIEFSKVVGFVM